MSSLLVRHADSPALMSPDGQVVSFERLSTLIASFAARLAAEGISAGQCVIPMPDNSVVRIALVLALLRLGADVAMPGALASPGVKFDAVIRLADQPVKSGDARDILFTQDWLSNPTTPVPPPSRDAHIIFSTSGSTGTPKLVRFRSDRLLQSVRNHIEGIGASTAPFMVGVPETTMFGFYMLIRACLGGHAIMWMRGDATQMLEHSVALGVREFLVTPLAISDLAAAVEAGAPKPDLARIVIFGAITSRELFRRVEAAFSVPVAIALGASETGQTTYGITTSAQYLPGWSGKPLSTVAAKIADATPGGSGRILLRCDPWIGSEGYLGGEPIFDAGGWFDTGDVGHILPDGNLVIEGRSDNLINLGGTKLAAELVEMLACDFPFIREAVAVQLPETNPGMPELGVAVVADAGADLEALRLMLALKLRTRAPITVRSLPSLPRLPSDKVDRRATLAALG